MSCATGMSGASGAPRLLDPSYAGLIPRMIQFGCMFKTKNLFRVSLVLVLCLAALAQSTGFQIPASAFATPSADDKAQNPGYWQGYLQGEGVAGAILPDPSHFSTYQSYKAVFQSLYKPQAAGFFPINQNVGYDNALEDGANYLWVFLPTSCHNVVCQ